MHHQIVNILGTADVCFEMHHTEVKEGFATMKREFSNLKKDLQAEPSSETLSGACNTKEEDEDGEQSFCVTLPCSTFLEFDAMESELLLSRDKRWAMGSSNCNVYDECSRLAVALVTQLFIWVPNYLGFRRPSYISIVEGSHGLLYKRFRLYTDAILHSNNTLDLF